MNAKILCASLAIVWLTVPTAAALDLVMTFDGSVPYFDPQGVERTHELVGVVEAAKAIWEDIIEDEFTLEITYGWDDLVGNALGVYGERLLFDTHVNNSGPARQWFIDPTPLDHSEFNFNTGQLLYRDVDADSDWFTGDVPDCFEIGYVGRPVQQGRGSDLLTVALHEIGHWLGVYRFNAYDINPDFVAGAVMGIEAETGHLLVPQSLMFGGVGNSRKLPTAADVFALASNQGWTRIDLPRQDFFGRNGDVQWTNSFNWAGNQVPGARDDAYLRHGGTVRLAAASTEIQQVTDLLISDHTELVIEELARLKVESDPHAWDSHGRVTLNNQSRIVVIGNSSRAPALEARSMDIAQGSSLSLAGGTVRIRGDLAIDQCISDVMCPVRIGTASQITGYGRIEVDTRLNNSGQIVGVAHPTVAAQRTLSFVAKQSEGTVWNLSASPRIGEPAFEQIVASQGDVRFSGGAAAAFRGQMLAENGYSIQFDTATLSMAGELIVRDISSFIFSPRIENAGSIELISGGSLRTLQFRNAGGTIRGDGRVVFSDSFINDAGSIVASGGQTLAFAATSRNVHWDLAGNSSDSHWRASDGGSIRFGAAAAEVVHFETFGGSLLADSGGSIELAFQNDFEFPVGRSGRLDIVGPGSILTARHAALMIGIENGVPAGKAARVRIDQGRLEANSLYIGGDDNGGIADAVLELNQGVVTASREVRIWQTGRVDGAGVINADVVNDGALRIETLAGSLRIHGSYSQGPAGILSMEVNNTPMRDRLEIEGDASLDGILELTFRSRPSIGDTFDLMDYRSVTGDFREIVLPPHVRAEFNVATGQLVVIDIVPEPSTIRIALLCIGSPIVPRKRGTARHFRKVTGMWQTVATTGPIRLVIARRCRSPT